MLHRLAPLCALLVLPACRDGRCDAAGPVVAVSGEGALAGKRTLSVTGDAEIFTAPDTFVITVGFELQAPKLEQARDDSRARAAALMDVVARHQIPACDVQTDQLTLHPQYQGYGDPNPAQLLGYRATRSMTVTLHKVEDVEPVLYDMLAAGANRVERVAFETSALQAKRSEARVLAVQAARAKAEAMAAALGQEVGEPLKIDEGGAQTPWNPAAGNYVLTNETAARIGETVATGKISVGAGVSVTFALRG